MHQRVPVRIPAMVGTCVADAQVDVLTRGLVYPHVPNVHLARGGRGLKLIAGRAIDTRPPLAAYVGANEFGVPKIERDKALRRHAGRLRQLLRRAKVEELRGSSFQSTAAHLTSTDELLEIGVIPDHPK